MYPKLLGMYYTFCVLYQYTVLIRIISTVLVNLIKEGCENKSALFILLYIFHSKKSQRSNLY